MSPSLPIQGEKGSLDFPHSGDTGVVNCCLPSLSVRGQSGVVRISTPSVRFSAERRLTPDLY